MKFFAFIAGLKGPEGQIFDETPKDGSGKPKQVYLFGPEKIENDMTLDQAILKFKDKVADRIELSIQPDLSKNILSREAKKLNMEFDAQFNTLTKAEREEFLDKHYGKE